MDKNNCKLNNSDRAIRIDLLAKAEGVASAENYFDSFEGTAKTNKTYGALLNCYCKANNLDKALSLFQKMKELGFVSCLNYNNMMTLYASIQQPKEILSLVQEMEENNIEFDSYTYTQLMTCYASMNDFDGVEGVVEKMKKNGVKCDWFTFINLAKIYVNAGHMEKANAAIAEVEKLKNLRELEAFHSLITMYVATSNVAGVYRAWESLKSVYPKPINVSYLTILVALSKLGEVDALEKHFREWESNCSNYDLRIANTMLVSYLERDMVEEAELICENIRKNGIEPNLRTYEAFTKFYIKKREIDLALKNLEMGVATAILAKNNGFPSNEVLKTFLNYFEEEKDVDKAEKFCSIMKATDRLDSSIYDSLLGKKDSDTELASEVSS